jgi:HJR/Mrr/RecB family endonuclease
MTTKSSTVRLHMPAREFWTFLNGMKEWQTLKGVREGEKGLWLTVKNRNVRDWKIDLSWVCQKSRNRFFGLSPDVPRAAIAIEVLHAKDKPADCVLLVGITTDGEQDLAERVLEDLLSAFPERATAAPVPEENNAVPDQPLLRPDGPHQIAARQVANELRAQVKQDPRNGDLQWKLARQIAGIDLPEVMDDQSSFWTTAELWLPVTPNLEDARSIAELALALGIPDALNSARAHYFVVIVGASEGYATHHTDDGQGGKIIDQEVPRTGYPHPYRDRMYVGKRIKVGVEVTDRNSTIHLRAVISETERYLRRDPRSLDVLYLQREAARFLLDKEKIAQLEYPIAQALRLREAGLAPGADQGLTTLPGNNARTDGRDLEDLTKRLLTAMGLKTTTTKTTGDGGIDLIAVSESPVFSGTYIVQCKDWANPVGEPIVRDLYGVVTSERANKGILITTGSFTPAAVRFADGKPLELIDGDGLAKLLRQFNLNWTPGIGRE